MVCTQDLTRGARRSVPIWAVSAVVLSVLSACGSTGCGSGADSAPEAVRELLKAASSGGSEDEICRYVPKKERVGLALQVVGELEPQIKAAGGVEEFSISDQPERQMGGEHVVSVTGPAGLVRDFSVVEEDGRFTVNLIGQPNP